MFSNLDVLNVLHILFGFNKYFSIYLSFKFFLIAKSDFNPPLGFTFIQRNCAKLLTKQKLLDLTVNAVRQILQYYWKLSIIFIIFNFMHACFTVKYSMMRFLNGGFSTGCKPKFSNFFYFFSWRSRISARRTSARCRIKRGCYSTYEDNSVHTYKL